MNLLIFGAGASYGSDTRGPLPPLGDGLLEGLVSFSPNSWGNLPEKYKEACRTDFEEGVKQISEDMPQNLFPLQRAMAGYFFNFIPRTTNLYLKLAGLIKASKWNLKGSLVTFNYERLLSMCLTASNIQPAVGVEEINETQIEVCFPHGTCNLFCSGIRASTGVLFNGNVIGVNGGPPECIVEPWLFQYRINTDSIPPIMSYFEPQKRSPAGRSFITSQRKRYEQMVHDSKKIGIVGLKVREWDTHIWGCLADTDAEIIYCAGKRGTTEFSAWAKENRSGKKDVILDGYFADCFETICSELEIT